MENTDSTKQNPLNYPSDKPRTRLDIRSLSVVLKFPKPEKRIKIIATKFYNNHVSIDNNLIKPIYNPHCWKNRKGPSYFSYTF